MNMLDFAALVLASRAVLAAWFQEGGLFAKYRAYYEVRGGKLGKLATCDFCLAYHVPLVLFVLFMVPMAVLELLGVSSGLWGVILKAPMYTLAATTVVHFLNKRNSVQLNSIKEENYDGSKGFFESTIESTTRATKLLEGRKLPPNEHITEREDNK